MIKVKWQHVQRDGATDNDTTNGNAGTTITTSSTKAYSPVMDAIIIGSHNSSTSTLGGFRRPNAKWDMGTISEDTLPPVEVDEWSNPQFRLNQEGEVRNKKTNEKLTKIEIREHGEEILRGLIDHVHTRMLREFQFLEQAIPALEFERESIESSFNPLNSIHSSNSSTHRMSVRSSSSSICSTTDGFRMMVDTDVPRCIFHTSQNFSVAEKLLVFVCSSRGLSCGIWSRSVLLQDGVATGSMIPYFQAAIKAGYGVLVMNPNMNTQMMVGPDGVPQKMPIQGSSTQEEHCEHVWKNYIFPSGAHKIHFIAYGYGGTLVANLIEKYRNELKSRLGNVAYIESRHKLDENASSSFRRFFSQHSICWTRAEEPLNTDLSNRVYNMQNLSFSMQGTETSSDDSVENCPKSPSSEQVSGFGCLCLSAGPLDGPTSNPALTTKAVLDEVFKFLGSPSAYEYHRMAERALRLQALMEEQEQQREFQRKMAKQVQHYGRGSSRMRKPSSGRPSSAPNIRASLSRLNEPLQREYDTLSIDDFHLLRVVGRGAFGKVLLVKKKSRASPSHHMRSPTGPMSATQAYDNNHSNKVYAMKIIKKSAVFAKNQVEHTKTERRILQGVDHPFMVKLRYAFQNESKLYFVMDYYNGGTLHFHLRRALTFDEPRTRFYAAQLVLAISHLHTYNIVYRDLKPENILLDDKGFIALTDFGLSRDNLGSQDRMQTFCGTPEYIAPELIRRIPYGKAVDYWSLGVLIFEMLAGYTPFYHSNRKRNFENIVRLPLRFPPDLSDDAKSLLRGLICKDPAKRLGSGPCGASEIMDHPFFADVDWEKLFKKEVAVPFRPVVRKDGDTNNIPDFFKRQEVVDSVASEAPIGKTHAFQGFSYTDPYQL